MKDRWSAAAMPPLVLDRDGHAVATAAWPRISKCSGGMAAALRVRAR
ncbi:MAG TPA: hypothetical protein VJ901_13655 [Thermoanaerobaculia bacterium]|nr:hypothetical protein [Thermoanaerobaculia bacterium]